jgi:basic membrane protein A
VVSACAVALMLGGVLSACGSSSSKGGTAAAKTKAFKACMVSGTGGIDDRGFNQSAWEGVQAAVKHLGLPSGDAKVLQPKTDSDYVPQIQAFVAQRCDVIVTVGFEAGDATTRAAKSNPRQRFAIVDEDVEPPLPNLASLVFDSAEVSFLGGYAAAGVSKTGTVGTFGGSSNPPVNTWMDGYYDGVQYYNQKHGTHVKVIGWSEPTQKGLYTDSYSDQTKGQQLADQLISQGADTVFPVAGNVNLGASRAAQESGKSVGVLWSDTNGCQAAQQFCDTFLGSATKNIASTVQKIVTTTYQGHFKGGTEVGTLRNGGVDFIVGTGKAGARIPAPLRSDLEKVKQGIANGSIPVKSRNKPKATA